jgi:hypothetical protein
MKRTIILLIISVAEIKKGIAQQPVSTHWATVQLPVSLNKHWEWINEVSYRTLGESFTMNQLFLRAGAKYSFSKKWTATAATDLVFTKVSLSKENHVFGKENRLWQQVSFLQPLKHKVTLQNRIRVEERFFSATPVSAAYHAFRFRYMLAATKTVTQKWSVILSDEQMEQLKNKRLGFNQNRITINNLYQWKPDIQLQAGFLISLRPGLIQNSFTVGFQKRFHMNKKKYHGV